MIPPEAQTAARRGDLITAIRITREATSMGLAEAKAAVEHFLAGERDPPAAAGEVPASAMAALQEGDLIGAIRLLREANGGGLKDSRDAIDAYLTAHPLLREQYQAARRQRRGGWRRFIVPLLLVVAAVLVLLRLSGA